MTQVINKKNLTRCLATAGFFVLLLSGSFLFCEETLAVGDYNKVPTATLSAGEWNGLMVDFVKTWATSTMVGPLGIGTTNPGAPLEVIGLSNTTGSIRITTPNVTDAPWIEFSTPGVGIMGRITNSNGFRFKSGYDVSMIPGSGYAFKVWNPTATIQYLTVLGTSGNVGIGNSAPNDIFSIGNAGSAPAGSSNTGHNFTSTYLGSDDYALTNYGLVKTLISSATSSISTLWAGVTSGHIWNLNTGNIGIGTSSPLFKLEVSGTFKVSTSSSSIILDSGGNVLIGI